MRKAILLLALCLLLGRWAFSQNGNDVQEILNRTMKADTILAADLHSFIVMLEDEVIFSSYYNNFAPSDLNNLKSITKSVVGLLVGIAIDQGYLEGLDQLVLEFFSECEQNEMFQAKADITIEHLLLMQSGIAWNNRALIKDDWWFNEDPHCFLLENFPMDTIPGQRFSYNSAVAHLLSGVLSRATEMSTLEFARINLFEPLGIDTLDWSQDAAGEYYGNSELALRPADMLKIGKMLLREGRYQGQQVVPTQWVRTIHGKAYDATSLMDYGYLWMTSKTDDPYFFFAGGSGGQQIVVVPSKEAVVVTTGHWDNARSTREILEMTIEVIRSL